MRMFEISKNFWNKATIFLKQTLKDYKLSRLTVKAKMGNWGTTWLKCGRKEWEFEKWDRDACVRNQYGNSENLVGNTKNAGNQECNAGKS